MNEQLLCGNGRQCLSRDDQAVHYGMSGQVICDMGGVAFIPPPGTGWDFSLPLLKEVHL